MSFRQHRHRRPRIYRTMARVSTCSQLLSMKSRNLESLTGAARSLGGRSRETHKDGISNAGETGARRGEKGNALDCSDHHCSQQRSPGRGSRQNLDAGSSRVPSPVLAVAGAWDGGSGSRGFGGGLIDKSAGRPGWRTNKTGGSEAEVVSCSAKE
jgi:hypothetical protein